jgi:hypothetical protein
MLPSTDQHFDVVRECKPPWELSRALTSSNYNSSSAGVLRLLCQRRTDLILRHLDEVLVAKVTKDVRERRNNIHVIRTLEVNCATKKEKLRTRDRRLEVNSSTMTLVIP